MAQLNKMKDLIIEKQKRLEQNIEEIDNQIQIKKKSRKIKHLKELKDTAIFEIEKL